MTYRNKLRLRRFLIILAIVLLALLICGATGVGLVLLLPGCTALMMTTAWSESLKKEEYRQQQNAA